MRRALLCLVLVCSLVGLTSCLSQEVVEYENNPFSSVVALSNKSDDDTISFACVTDVHINRENDTKDVYRYDDSFFSFLREKDPSFVINLGDLSDDGLFTENVFDFLSEVESIVGVKTISVVGNHERHALSDFTEIDSELGCYRIGKLSLYKLDTSYGTIGRDQFKYLESAVSRDTSEYKMIITHTNIATGGTLDQSLVLMGLYDSAEINKLIRIMAENGINLVLSGHHHTGNILYSLGGNRHELNMAAYHERRVPLNYESDGYFYLCTLNQSSGEMTIEAYLARDYREGNEPSITFTIKM